MELKVVSWNIWMSGNLEKVAGFIKDSSADIIGLQEVIPEREPNIIESIEALGYRSAFATAHERRKDGCKMGNAIFSKLPIIREETFVLSPEIGEMPDAEYERRVALRADVEVNGIPLRLFSTHLAHVHQASSAQQRRQLEHLLAALPEERTIIMGDFNATPQSETIRRAEEILSNSDPSGKPTWSLYPEGCKTCNPQALDTRLDYIFTTRDLKTRSPKVERSDASDHLPISAAVEI